MTTELPRARRRIAPTAVTAEPSPAREKPARHRPNPTNLVLFGLIALLVFAAFWPAMNASFVDLDDQLFVFENPHVLAGLTPASVAWALTNHDVGLYIPITRLSLLLDGTISRLLWDDADASRRASPLPDAAVYHLTNILLHVAAAWMLFLFLYRATCQRSASFAVALLWAVHPLRVESVAWVTERKDEVAGVFGFLSMYLYVASRQAQGRGQRWRFWASCGTLVLSMWGKPMFATMPILLLLLDYWPLERIRSSADLRTAVLEKWPMWLIVLLGALVTIFTAGSVSSLPISQWEKSANAMLTYLRYMIMQVDFVQLAPFYPFTSPPWPQVFVAIAIVAAVTAAVVWQRRRWPWLMWGWLVYLAAAFPTIGFIQKFSQGYADRYSYLGSVGLIGMVVFSAFQWRRATGALVAAAIALAVVLAAFSYRQTLYWHDTITLFERARDITPPSKELHWSLGHGYLRAQRLEDAQREFAATVAADPAFPDSHLALAYVYKLQNRPDLALPEAQTAFKLSPGFGACKLCGLLLMQNGQYDQAAQLLQTAAAKQPDDVEVRSALRDVQLKLPASGGQRRGQ